MFSFYVNYITVFVTLTETLPDCNTFTRFYLNHNSREKQLVWQRLMTMADSDTEETDTLSVGFVYIQVCDLQVFVHWINISLFALNWSWTLMQWWFYNLCNSV